MEWVEVREKVPVGRRLLNSRVLIFPEWETETLRRVSLHVGGDFHVGSKSEGQ